VYGMEAWDALTWFGVLRNYIPIRLDITCKSPLPKTQIAGESGVQDGSVLERIFLCHFPNITAQTSEPSDPVGSTRGVFIKALGEKAFAKHMESLKTY